MTQRTAAAQRTKDKLQGLTPSLRIIAVEPTACPSLTKGKYVYDFGDTVGMTPLVKMHTLGHTFGPAPVHAGGLRYHGMAPLVCKLYDEGSIEAVAVPQLSTFQAALQRAPMTHVEYREQVIKRQICLMHERGIWVEPER